MFRRRKNRKAAATSTHNDAARAAREARREARRAAASPVTSEYVNVSAGVLSNYSSAGSMPAAAPATSAIYSHVGLAVGGQAVQVQSNYVNTGAQRTSHYGVFEGVIPGSGDYQQPQATGVYGVSPALDSAAPPGVTYAAMPVSSVYARAPARQGSHRPVAGPVQPPLPSYAQSLHTQTAIWRNVMHAAGANPNIYRNAALSARLRQSYQQWAHPAFRQAMANDPVLAVRANNQLLQVLYEYAKQGGQNNTPQLQNDIAVLQQQNRDIHRMLQARRGRSVQQPRPIVQPQAGPRRAYDRVPSSLASVDMRQARTAAGRAMYRSVSASAQAVSASTANFATPVAGSDYAALPAPDVLAAMAADGRRSMSPVASPAVKRPRPQSRDEQAQRLQGKPRAGAEARRRQSHAEQQRRLNRVHRSAEPVSPHDARRRIREAARKAGPVTSGPAVPRRRQ